MKEVVFPGSFDPVTNGHIDLIKRARAIFGAVRVVVLCNKAKKTLFTMPQRVNFLQEALQGEDNIVVESWEGLLADYMEKKGLCTLVRGLRSAHDWNAERTNAHYNHLFNSRIETVFLPACTQYQYISSSAVKEALTFGADVSSLVPPCVAEYIRKR